MRLHPTVPFIDGETPASFASRLALMNGVTLDSFCRDFQLGKTGLIRGVTESLELLSELANVDPAILAQAGWRAERPFAHFRGHEFNARDRDAEGSRACIQCLVDDQAADSRGACICFRGEWRILGLRTCAIHGMPIVPLPKVDQLLKWDFAARVVAQKDALIVPSLRRAPSGLETYVRSRVHGVPHEPNWLDTFPVRAVISACGALGSSAEFGEHNRKLLTDDQWWEASRRGFDIARGGPEAILAFLKDCRIPTHGALYQWLCVRRRSDPAYDPFREIMRRHFADTVAFNPKTTMFGKPLPEREFHSVVSAAQVCRVSQRIIRRLVLDRLPEPEKEMGKTDGELTFKAADFADDFRRLASALRVRELHAYAGCKPRTTQTLINKGFIKPILAPTDGHRGILRFAREDVDAFVVRLSAQAETVDVAPPGALPIALSPAHIPCTVEVVINLILARKLSWLGRLEGVHGFDGLLVDASEVRTKALGPAPDALIFHQAFHMCGVNGSAFLRLVQAGLIKLLPIIQPGNRPATAYIAFEEVVRFRENYVVLADLSRQLRSCTRTIKSALNRAGIRALDLGFSNLVLYERAHVARVYPSIMEHDVSPKIGPRRPPPRRKRVASD